MTDFSDEKFFELTSPLWAIVLRFGLAAIVGLFYLTVSLHFQYTPDDTYIYMQYARNLARGDGFSFNAGVPSYGVTGPLWTLFIAVGTKMGLDSYVVAKTFDLVFACLAILLAHMLTFLLTRDRVYAIGGALLVATDAWLLRWAGSGMETSFAMFICLLTVRYIVTRDFELASFGAGLLTLVRPEGAFLLAVVLFEAARHWRRGEIPARRLGIIVTFASIPLMTWMAYAVRTFGTIMPNTYSGKIMGGFSFADAGETALQLVKIIGSTEAIAALVLVVGTAVAWARHGWRFVWEEAAPLAVLPALGAAYLLMNANVVSRYLLPFMPLIPVYALWSLKHLELHYRWTLRRTAVVLAAVLVIGVVQNVVVFGTKVVPHLIAFTRGMDECFKPIGFWLRSHSQPDAVVLGHDIGMVGYISERTVYDTPGLISPEVRRALGREHPDSAMAVRWYEAVVKPDYVIDRSVQKERLAAPDMIPELTRPFEQLGISVPQTVYFTVYRVVR